MDKPTRIFLTTTLIAVTMVAAAGVGAAATLSQTRTATLSFENNNPSNAQAALVFPKFDPSLGTLTGVAMNTTVDLNLILSMHLGTFGNYSYTNVGLTATSFITGPGGLNLPFPGATPLYSNPTFDGAFPSQAYPVVSTTNVTTQNPTDLADYIGPGTQTLTFAASITKIPGNSTQQYVYVNIFPDTEADATIVLTYTYTPGTSAPPLQISPIAPISLQVVPNEVITATGQTSFSANEAGNWNASTTAPWLALNQISGTFPGGISVTANAAGLAVGSYAGSVTLQGQGPGGNQAASFMVNLQVLPPASLLVSPAAINAVSQYTQGSAWGIPIEVGPAGVPFTASTSAYSKSWLTIGPVSGIGPAAITVTVDPSQAAMGTYTDAVTIVSAGAPNSPVTVPVTLKVVGGALQTLVGQGVSLPQQVNAATEAGPDHTVAPNEMVSLNLNDFNCATAPVVSFDGVPVAWSSYAGSQISYAVPGALVQPEVLSVGCNGTTAWTFNGLNLAASVPGIFTLPGTGTGQAAALNADGTVNSATNAASRGSDVAVFVTGLGVFDATSGDGLRHLAGTVTATMGGVSATVIYAGEAPGETDSVQQINVQIPAGIAAGSAVPVVLAVNGTPTQSTATIGVK